MNGWTYASAFADSWGVSRSNLSKTLKNYVHCGLYMERKQRSNKVNIVFNSEEKQKHLCTPFNIHKKEITLKFRDDPGRMDMVGLFQEFYALPTNIL